MKLSETIAEWSFDVFACSEDELVVLAKEMFIGLAGAVWHRSDDVGEVLGHSEELLQQSIPQLRHAFDVAQAALSVLVQFGGRDTLTQLDVLSLLVALLCHDMGHPGVSNDFMVKTASDVAMLYNDQSVLENLHCCLIFKLLHYHPDIKYLCLTVQTRL